MANLAQLGIPGIGTGILMPKLKHRWRVVFSNIGTPTDSRNLSMQLITATRPVLTFDEVQLDRYNSKAWVAGKYTFEPITLTLEDDLTNSASKVIQDQLQRQQHLIGQGSEFLPVSPEGRLYKFNMRLEQMDGQSDVVEAWDVQGCFLQNVDYSDLDYAASDAVQITLTVRYDHAAQIFKDYNKGEGIATGTPGEGG